MTFSSAVKNIWLTEDDPDDIVFFQEALQNIYPSAQLTSIDNGAELIDRLNSHTAPDLLFLDINMPCKDGHSCLKEIRSKHQFRSLPIIVYSGSPRPLDINYSYSLGANLYIHKPSRYGDILLLLGKVLELDWQNPQDITNSYFVDGNYVPFVCR